MSQNGAGTVATLRAHHLTMQRPCFQQPHIRHPPGLYEITKLAVAKGANPLTMSGLAGMGDLVLTCTGGLGVGRGVGVG